jgi:nitrous oxidase accessory protein NosD
MKRRVAVVLFAAVAAAGLYAGPAAASHVLVVDDDNGGCRFGGADHRTIQRAVDEAEPGGRILVCPGTYVETVKVGKHLDHLTIEGAKAGLDARWRSQRHESVVTLGDPDDLGPNIDPVAARVGLVRLEADGVRWDGFLIADNQLGPGMFTSRDASGYDIRNTVFNDNGLGVHLGASGKRLTRLWGNRFHANNEFEKDGAGTGVYSDRGARCVQITDNLFELHNEAAILFADSGNAQRCVWVERNKSIDDNTFAAFYASSHVHVVANTIRSGRAADGDAPAAIFIGGRNSDVVVAHNRIRSTHGTGIGVRNSGTRRPLTASVDVELRENKVRNAEHNGIEIAAPGGTGYVVKGNRSLQNKKVGIFVERTRGVRFAGNTALDNGALDCRDLTRGAGTAGTANTWTGNVGGSARPPGICGPGGRAPKPVFKHHGDHGYQGYQQPKRQWDGDAHGHEYGKGRGDCHCEERHGKQWHDDKQGHDPRPPLCLPWGNKPQ